jgi:hypothetical protein
VRVIFNSVRCQPLSAHIDYYVNQNQTQYNANGSMQRIEKRRIMQLYFCNYVEKEVGAVLFKTIVARC